MSALIVACDGSISGDPNIDAGRPGPTTPTAEACADVVRAPRHRLIRLTIEQWARLSAEALALDAPVDVAYTIDREAGVAGFASPVETDARLVEALFAASADAAEGAIRNHDRIDPCDLTDATCREGYLSVIGTRLLRRPMQDADLDELRALYDEDLADGRTPDEAMVAQIRALLLDAEYLYRVERHASETGIEALDPYALASRMSFLIWGSGPDEALLQAAAAGELETEEQVRAQAVRMLDDGRASHRLEVFADEWLELDHLEHLRFDPTLMSEYDTPEKQEELGHALRAQVLEFLVRGYQEEMSYDELFTSNELHVDDVTAPLYGAGEARGIVNLPDRPGLLGHAGLLAGHGSTNDGRGTSPIHRGVWVLQKFLCASLPPPPSPLPDYCPSACEADADCGSDRSCAEGLCVSNNADVCTSDDDCGGYTFDYNSNYISDYTSNAGCFSV